MHDALRLYMGDETGPLQGLICPKRQRAEGREGESKEKNTCWDVKQCSKSHAYVGHMFSCTVNSIGREGSFERIKNPECDGHWDGDGSDGHGRCAPHQLFCRRRKGVGPCGAVDCAKYHGDRQRNHIGVEWDVVSAV